MKKIIFTIIISMFSLLFTIDVKAESLDCRYNLKVGGNAGAIEIVITKINGVINISKDYSINVPVSIVIDAPSTVLDGNIRRNDGLLDCPTFYVKETTSYGMDYLPIFTGSFTFEKRDGYDILKHYYENIVNDPVTPNDPSDPSDPTPNESEVLTSCTYNTRNNTDRVFSFEILKDGTVKNIQTNGIFSNTNNTYGGFTGLTSCPAYIKYVCDSGYCGISPSETPSTGFLENHLVYAGAVPSVNAPVIYYNLTSNTKITVEILSDKTVQIRASGNDVTNLVTNFSDSYQNIFKEIKTSEYPSYIYAKSGGTSYELSSEMKKIGEDNITAVYVLSSKVNEVVALGKQATLETCQQLLGDSFINFIQTNVFNIVYIGVPILLLVLTTIDFAKVVFVDDKEGIQGAGKRFTKRVIVSILIFLVPVILTVVIRVLGINAVGECVKTFGTIKTE